MSFLFLAFFSLLNLHQNFSFKLDGIFLLNNYSMMLVFLTFFLFFLCQLSLPTLKDKSYLLCFFWLSLFLFLVFSSSNVLIFYSMFEASLIPTLILILSWGYQPERLMAGSFMMLYTVSASLPFLLLILYMWSVHSSMEVSLLKNISVFNYTWMTFFMYMAFLVKLPMYSVHLWLPKAHVEAPLAGSMLLAGILLKLGGYGVFLMNYTYNLYLNNISMIFIVISLWGGVLAMMMCLRQNDMKALVAYSSVGHMSVVISGLLLDSYFGLFSSLIIMISHGVTSSAMFCLTFFTYNKFSTRSFTYMKGVLKVFPILSLMWFLVCCINMAAPPSINLLGELLVASVLLKYSIYLTFFMALMVFLAAAYNMFLYSSLNHGGSSMYLKNKCKSSVSSFEIHSIFCHSLPLLLLLKLNFFS
nr:NADH dehydrogenase subunit 4 [Runcina aurata]